MYNVHVHVCGASGNHIGCRMNIYVYVQIYILSSDVEKLSYLYRAVHLLSARWIALSIQLSVRGLDQIQRNGRTSDICLALSLMEWLQSGEASWKGLVEAVFRPSGGGHQVLARDIANSYKSM